MKKWFKIILLTFFILFLIALTAVVITAIQINQIMDMTKESESFTSNFESLQKGDCSKLPEVEAKYEETKTKIKYFCMNPIIRIGLEKISKSNIDFCSKINQENEIEGNLTIAKDYCAGK